MGARRRTHFIFQKKFQKLWWFNFMVFAPLQKNSKKIAAFKCGLRIFQKNFENCTKIVERTRRKGTYKCK